MTLGGCMVVKYYSRFYSMNYNEGVSGGVSNSLIFSVLVLY